MRLCVASSRWTGLLHSRVSMKLGRRASNLLLGMGIFMLLSWTIRAYTWYANDLQSSPYLALVHLPIIAISLAIGAYLTYLGIRGRRATSQ